MDLAEQVALPGGFKGLRLQEVFPHFMESAGRSAGAREELGRVLCPWLLVQHVTSSCKECHRQEHSLGSHSSRVFTHLNHKPAMVWTGGGWKEGKPSLWRLAFFKIIITFYFVMISGLGKMQN